MPQSYLVRKINNELRPYALIDPNGPHGDQIVAGYLTEDQVKLYADAPETAAQNERLRTSNAELLAALKPFARAFVLRAERYKKRGVAALQWHDNMPNDWPVELDVTVGEARAACLAIFNAEKALKP